jgi:hypothetical protein
MYGVECHMCKGATYPVWRGMLGYTDDQTLQTLDNYQNNYS